MQRSFAVARSTSSRRFLCEEQFAASYRTAFKFAMNAASGCPRRLKDWTEFYSKLDDSIRVREICCVPVNDVWQMAERAALGPAQRVLSVVETPNPRKTLEVLLVTAPKSLWASGNLQLDFWHSCRGVSRRLSTPNSLIVHPGVGG